MNLLTIVGFFSNLFNLAVSDWFLEVLYKMILFCDAIAYFLLSYSFKLFQLMCTLNFNSLYNMISGVLSRIEALVLVFVVYKLGIALINFMLKPDEAAKKGKDILVNIFITAALLLSYNTIFTLFNELSMLIVGAPEGYSYIVLGQIAEISGGADSGLLNRVVFGTEEQIPDIGEFVSFSICSTFITYSKDPDNTEPLKKVLNDNGKLNFFNLTNIAAHMGKEFEWFPIMGFVSAGFMIFQLVKATIQIGVRAFKMLILQILAPVAIITIIGEGVKGKTFQNFIKKYIAVYIEVFVRMFSMLLVCNFVVKFIRNILDYFPTIDTNDNWTKGLMVALIIVAAFKFAGDIPKFIDDILSTHLSTGKDKNFIGALLGGGIGLVSGLATGTLGGTIAGLSGGISSGSKGNSVADFFKGMSTNSANARNVAANQRMTGGHIPGLSALRYGMTRLGGAVGLPQSRLDRGKTAGERQTAMDNMVKALEENYDRKAKVNGTDVGLNRDIFKTYAYKPGDVNKYFDELSEQTQQEVEKTNTAYDSYTAAQGVYDNIRSTGKVYDDALGSYRTATDDDMQRAFDKVESTRTAYQTLKANTDKKIDTDYNSMMLRDMRRGKNIKDKGRNTVKQAISTYDNVASSGYSSRQIARRNVKANTKLASDYYTKQQDRTTHSRSASSWTNSNLRGGGGGGASK